MKRIGINLITPRFQPPLDPGFRPAALANASFLQEVAASSEPVPLNIAVENDTGQIYVHRTQVFPSTHPRAGENVAFVERLVKVLLWQWGGWKVTIAGPRDIADQIAAIYAKDGARSFDCAFWGNLIHQKEFTVQHADVSEMQADSDATTGSTIQLSWTGWRIGFDLGASDKKIAIVKDGALALDSAGEPILSCEIAWDPKPQTDPAWHFQEILEILRLAEAKIKEVDPDATAQAIGGSAAGIYANGRVRMASLFRGIEPRERFEKEIAPLFSRLKEATGNIPFRIENDGDVTALAGAIALGEGPVLGLAMGSSLAAGYVDPQGQILGWKNELAFAPVDYNPDAPVDEWSGDRGVGANYFSQQAVGRLIPAAGIEMPDIPEDRLPERLVRVQELMAQGDERARKIYETIGCYFGYTIPHYAMFYRPLKHIEVLGRVMTGEGGQIILQRAQEVLKQEFPSLSEQISFYEPDEREKRHGQAAAAAYLPQA